MSSSQTKKKLNIFFFPFLAHGHIIPMAHLARLFSNHHDINSTIITTPSNSKIIEPLFDAHTPNIELVLLPFPSTANTNLPPNCENVASLPHPRSLHVLNLFDAVELLKKPFTDLLEAARPDFLISDWVYTWTTDLANSLCIPRLVFQTCGAFSNTICDVMHVHASYGAGHEMFHVPGIAHEIKLCRAELPPSFDHPPALDMLRDAEAKSFGMVLNSFHELEPWYVDFLRSSRKFWCVGPVGLNTGISGNVRASSDLAKWLESKDDGTVLYVCFGSECMLSGNEMTKLELGLETSGLNYAWVRRSGEDDDFEITATGTKGLVIKGWAPQTWILNHPTIGGFLTHCGWNSILEGASAGVPMVTWPQHSEQFINEKLVVDVLGIGVKVLEKKGGFIDAETICKAIKSLMVGDDSVEMRKRAKGYRVKARRAVEGGGSSHTELKYLINEMLNYENFNS